MGGMLKVGSEEIAIRKIIFLYSSIKTSIIDF